MNENFNRPLTDDTTEIDLIDLFYYYLSKWPYILMGLLVGAVIAGCYTFFMITPKYTATSKLYMVSSSNDSVVDLTDLNIGTSLSSDYAELLKVRPILEGIIEEEHLDYNYEQLSKMITLTSVGDTRILVIQAESTSPKEAMTIANALADKAESEIPRLMSTSKPNIAEYAIQPAHKSSPSLTKNTLIGALLGMLILLAFFTVPYLMDDTINSSDDVEKLFGALPLTVIPEGKLDHPGQKNLTAGRTEEA